jgi:DMSO/TMAO reductase YedYZ molybdopterin-dependent catalytic subunit
VPGYYGTNSVKWLTRMTLAETRANGPFTTRWYNDPVVDSAGVETGTTKPVWSIAPEAIIVAPSADDVIAIGATTQIWGWAWSDRGIAGADVSVDGDGWVAAEIETPRGREWQRFSLPWRPERAGRVALRVRATSVDGEHQPLADARNAVHEITVTVK